MIIILISFYYYFIVKGSLISNFDKFKFAKFTVYKNPNEFTVNYNNDDILDHDVENSVKCKSIDDIDEIFRILTY